MITGRINQGATLYRNINVNSSRVRRPPARRPTDESNPFVSSSLYDHYYVIDDRSEKSAHHLFLLIPSVKRAHRKLTPVAR